MRSIESNMGEKYMEIGQWIEDLPMDTEILLNSKNVALNESPVSQYIPRFYLGGSSFSHFPCGIQSTRSCKVGERP